jgi:hypothetical protein
MSKSKLVNRSNTVWGPEPMPTGLEYIWLPSDVFRNCVWDRTLLTTMMEGRTLLLTSAATCGLCSKLLGVKPSHWWSWFTACARRQRRHLGDHTEFGGCAHSSGLHLMSLTQAWSTSTVLLPWTNTLNSFPPLSDYVSLLTPTGNFIFFFFIVKYLNC